MFPGELTLIIEDEVPVRRFLRASLPPHGYSVVEAPTGQEGLAQAAARNPSLVLLDLGLPDLDGTEVARRLRDVTRSPIIVLSARDQDREKVAALDAGADDYLTKPFSMNELLARMRVARRHADSVGDAQASETFTAQQLRIDFVRRQVFVNDEEVHLTPIEHKLLAVLARNSSRVVTHQQLLRDVWGSRSATQRQYLHVYIGQLRSKLEVDPARPRLLLTESGVGYRLKVE